MVAVSGAPACHCHVKGKPNCNKSVSLDVKICAMKAAPQSVKGQLCLFSTLPLSIQLRIYIAQTCFSWAQLPSTPIGHPHEKWYIFNLSGCSVNQSRYLHLLTINLFTHDGCSKQVFFNRSTNLCFYLGFFIYSVHESFSREAIILLLEC